MSISNAQDGDYPEHENPKLRGDWCNIFLLLYMYILQCIPRGLAQAMPLILQNKNVTYEDQVSSIFLIAKTAGIEAMLKFKKLFRLDSVCLNIPTVSKSYGHLLWIVYTPKKWEGVRLGLYHLNF